MQFQLETPSRVLRRIEVLENGDHDITALPDRLSDDEDHDDSSQQMSYQQQNSKLAGRGGEARTVNILASLPPAPLGDLTNNRNRYERESSPVVQPVVVKQARQAQQQQQQQRRSQTVSPPPLPPVEAEADESDSGMELENGSEQGDEDDLEEDTSTLHHELDLLSLEPEQQAENDTQHTASDMDEVHSQHSTAASDNDEDNDESAQYPNHASSPPRSHQNPSSVPYTPASAISSTSSATARPPPAMASTSSNPVRFSGAATPRFAFTATLINPSSTTATPKASTVDIERRKEHLLNTLRSTAKPRFALGTPHHAASLHKVSTTNSDGEQSYSSDGASSHDLTTLHTGKANTSLPLSGGLGEEKSTRFNGTKLNSYLHSLNTHLTEENQSLAVEVGEKDKELERIRREMRGLEDTVREVSVSQAGISRVEDEEREREKDEEIAKLRDELARVSQTHEKDSKALGRRADELLEALEAKDGEIDAARQETIAQGQEFAEKMEKLEEELCRVMEEQEGGLEQAKAEMQERGRAWEVERERMEAVEEELKESREEVEELRKELEAKGAKEAAGAADAVRRLKGDVARLEDVIRERDERLAKLQTEFDEVEKQLAERSADLLTAAHNPTDANNDDALEELRRQLEEQTDNVRQLEEALEESATQLVQNEDELADLRTSLANEKSISASLSSQIAQISVHKTKAKSPLANEVSVDDTVTTSASEKDLLVSELEAELARAQGEIGQLKEQLLKLPDAAHATRNGEEEAFKTLEEHKVDLEERVTSLRQQVSSFSLTPRKGTPDSSFLFRSVLGVKTPRTPGQFLSNLSNWSPASVGDSTISPLLAQIHELELIVEQLQAQLASANEGIDSKLSNLDLTLTQQLAAARAKIAHLEREVLELKEERGDILRGVAELQKDLEGVRRNASSLGRDLAEVRAEKESSSLRREDAALSAKLQLDLVETRKKLRVFEQKVADHVCPSSENELGEMRARHSEEAKGLLVQIRFLKSCVTRQATFRDDLSLQKQYLTNIVRQKQSSIDSTLATLSAFGLPRPVSPPRAKLTFKGAARAVIAIARMKALKEQWHEQNVLKTRLRTHAYPATRGRTFVNTT